MGAAFADIANLCAPTMAVEQVAAVASVESALARLAIRFNSGGAPKELPKTEDQAVKLAGDRIAASEDIDLGLMGVNAALLSGLGLTVRGAFDPCLNIKAGVALLERYGADAVKSGVRGEFVEIEALERYFGKGDAALGAMSGFAERVRREAAMLKGKPITLVIKDWVPALPAREFTGDRGGPGPVAANVSRSVESARREPAFAGPPAPWDVFGVQAVAELWNGHTESAQELLKEASSLSDLLMAGEPKETSYQRIFLRSALWEAIADAAKSAKGRTQKAVRTLIVEELTPSKDVSHARKLSAAGALASLARPTGEPRSQLEAVLARVTGISVRDKRDSQVEDLIGIGRTLLSGSTQPARRPFFG